MTLVKSKDRYVITITKASGTYSNGAASLVPTGAPDLEILWNQVTSGIVEVHPIEVEAPTAIPIDEVLPGDILQIQIDTFNAFFGEIQDIDNVRRQGLNVFLIQAVDFRFRLAERQLNRAIYNGYLDSEPRIVTDGVTALKTGIRPIAEAFALQPQGMFNLNARTQANVAERQLFFRTSASDPDLNVQAAMIFTPAGRTIQRLWLPLLQESPQTIADFPPIGSRWVWDDGGEPGPLIVSIQTVRWNPTLTPGRLEPSGEVLLRRSGIRHAGALFQMQQQETWDNVVRSLTLLQTQASLPVIWTSSSPAVSGFHVIWNIDNGSAGMSVSGSSGVRFPDSNSGDTNYGFTGQRPNAGVQPRFPYLEVVFDGTNPVRFFTEDMKGTQNTTPNLTIGSTSNAFVRSKKGDSGWMSWEMRVDQSDTQVSFTVYIGEFESGPTTSEERLCTINFNTDGTLDLVHGAGTTQIAADYLSVGAFWNFAVKCDFQRQRFDFYHSTQAPFAFAFKRSVDVPKATAIFDLTPQDVSLIDYVVHGYRKFEVFMSSGASGLVQIGCWNACEIHMPDIVGRQFNEHWALLDFREDPIDVPADQDLAIVMEWNFATDRGITAASGIEDGIITIYTADAETSAAGFQRSASLNSNVDQDSVTPPVWIDSRDTASAVVYEYGFMIEYAESRRKLIEGSDFTVDYEGLQINWSEGTDFSHKPFDHDEFWIDDLGSLRGVNYFKSVIISEFENPALGGIISATAKMRLPDLAKHIKTLVPGLTGTPAVIIDGNLDDTDDADGVGFNTAAFEIPAYVAVQRSVLDIYRDLGQQYGALLLMAADSGKQLTFQAVKAIGGININSPGAHEYVLTTKESLVPASVDAAFVRGHTVGPLESGLFTRFTVIGADESIRVTKVNKTLEDTLGRVIERQPEIFNQVTDTEQLWLLAEALDAMHGVQVVEGEIVVSGYFPVGTNELLDINGIVKLIDDTVAGFEDATAIGTANVLKIHSIRFDGKTNQTTLFVSNRGLFRLTEQRLQELRNLLNGIQPHSAVNSVERTVFDDDVTGIDSGDPANDELFMALFVDDGSGGFLELSALEQGSAPLGDAAYQRQSCLRRVHDDIDHITYQAFFPAGVGAIPNDNRPVTHIELFDAQTGGTIKGLGVDLAAGDEAYKWKNVSLHVTMYIRDSDA